VATVLADKRSVFLSLFQADEAGMVNFFACVCHLGNKVEDVYFVRVQPQSASWRIEKSETNP